jgi:hypothetical protein
MSDTPSFKQVDSALFLDPEFIPEFIKEGMIKNTSLEVISKLWIRS